MKNRRTTLPLISPAMIRRKSHPPAIMEDRVSLWVWWVIQASHCSTGLPGLTGHSDLRSLSPPLQLDSLFQDSWVSLSESPLDLSLWLSFPVFISPSLFLFRMGERRRQEEGRRRNQKGHRDLGSFLKFHIFFLTGL